MNMAMTWIVALGLTLFGVAQARQGKLIFVDVCVLLCKPKNIVIGLLDIFPLIFLK